MRESLILEVPLRMVRAKAPNWIRAKAQPTSQALPRVGPPVRCRQIPPPHDMTSASATVLPADRGQ